MEKDLVIIGGGPGGYVAAIRAAQLGVKAVIVEKDRIGGTCLNRGCIPTKAFYRNAQLVHDIKRSEEFGIKLEGMTLDMGQMLERKQQAVDRLVGGISQLLKANGVEVLEGTGKLTADKTIEVTDAAGTVTSLAAKNILIASGSTPVKPPIPGIELPGVVTSDDILNLEKIPESLVIIGGGVIGIEFAGIFNALGTQVTVVEYMPQILPSLDGDISKRLALALKKKGITLETEVQVKEILQRENGLVVLGEGKKGELVLSGESILVSTGRAINTEGLNLEAVGIEYDKKGIKVNESYETTVPGIYAIGDVIGGQMLAHVASEEGKAAVENMMGLKGHMNYSAVPGCVFTFPEVAAVGVSEEEVKSRGITYSSSKFLFGANGKALTMGEEEGFVKVMADDTGKVIGVHIMGPHASDLIHEAALAIENGLTVSQVAKTIHAHPTLSEAFAEAAMGTENRAIHMVPQRPRK